MVEGGIWKLEDGRGRREKGFLIVLIKKVDRVPEETQELPD
jgi:hypothetical protein